MTELRSALQAGPVFGVWSTLPGVVAVAAVAGAGLDFVVFDLQHGAATEQTLPASCAAAGAAGLVPLVRARSAAFADVGRAFDLGAHGVIVPSILDLAHARQVLASARYPMAGNRSSGRLYGGCDEPLCVLMIETRRALADVEQIVGLDGLDGVYVGPNDLALALGGPAALGGEQVAQAIGAVIEACRAVGLPFGVHAATGAAARDFAIRGARIVTAVSDAAALAAAVRTQAEIARQPG
jgi:4-hydroxy-2-oxoheptanedioate aldolase